MSGEKKKLLLTGASGFIAGSVLAQRPEGWQVLAASRTRPPLEAEWLNWQPLPDALTPDWIAAQAPDGVLHCAAIAAIDYCETHKAAADRVNTDMALTVAQGAARCGARLIHLSTDNVFDGNRGDYQETDPPSPVNHYGLTKARAEKLVLAHCPEAVVARVSVVMGLPMVGAGNSFLSRMIPQFESGEPIGVPNDEIRSPIDSVTLGQALWELMDHDYCGLLHLSGNDYLNRCEMVQEIAAALGFPREQVYPNDPTVLPGRAPRPVNATLNNKLAHRVLRTPLCGFAEGMARILAWRDAHGP